MMPPENSPSGDWLPILCGLLFALVTVLIAISFDDQIAAVFANLHIHVFRP